MLTDDILAERFFKKQVDAGLKDVAEGRVVTHEEVKGRIAAWRSSAGREQFERRCVRNPG